MKLQYLVLNVALAASFARAGNPPLETLTHAKQAVMSSGCSCVLKDDGTVWCWGSFNGESRNYATPLDGITTATSLAAGGSHTCALLRDGTVECWGSDTYGELGNGEIGGYSKTPVFVHGVYTGDEHLTNVLNIATGDGHTCAQLRTGQVVCWGKNNYGQLGDGTMSTQSWPVYASLPVAATSIAAGYEHSCAVLSTNAMQCWGRNEYGQLGDGGSEPFSLPVYVKLAAGEVPVWARTNDNANNCVVLSNRSIKCWGLNEDGALGNGSDDGGSGVSHSTPTTVVISASPIQPLYPVSDVAVGYRHACAKMDDGLGSTSIQCWGDNRWGQLGDGGSEDYSDLPTAVLLNGNVSTPFSNILSVAAESFTTCAVQADGTVRCWGDDGYGQLGTGFFGDLSAPIFPVRQAVDEIFADGFN